MNLQSSGRGTSCNMMTGVSLGRGSNHDSDRYRANSIIDFKILHESTRISTIISVDN